MTMTAQAPAVPADTDVDSEWRVDFATTYGPYIRLPAYSGSYEVAKVSGDGFPEQRRRAYLIAAAPELKRACVEQQKLIEGAQDILVRYLVPGGLTAEGAINELLMHLDGPNQRRIKSLGQSAIAKTEPWDKG